MEPVERLTTKQLAGRNLAQRDLPFIWWEAVRAHTARRRQELVDGATLKPHLKRMLSLLHYRCSASGSLKRICWPSLNDLCISLKYDWPGAKRTISRQIADLKELGLLWTEDRSRKDGSQTSNVYAIRYGALRKYASPVVKETCLLGVVIMSTPVDAGVYGGRRPCLPPVGVMPTLELDIKEIQENEIAASGGGDVAGCQLPVVSDEKTNGGGEDVKTYADYAVQDRFTNNRQPTTGNGRKRPSGWWAGAVTRAILSERSNVVALYKSAVRGEVIADTAVNRVRVIALVIQALSMGDDQFRGTLGGYVISHIERGTWNYLDPKNVQTALQRLGGELQLTKDEKDLIRLAEARN